jgi:hypothetical protein
MTNEDDEDIQINTEYANDLPVEVTKKESVMNSEVNKKEVFNKGDLVYFPLVSDEPLVLNKSDMPINPKFPLFIDNLGYSFNSEGMMENTLTPAIWKYTKENSEKLSEFYGRTFEYELSGTILTEWYFNQGGKPSLVKLVDSDLFVMGGLNQHNQLVDMRYRRAIQAVLVNLDGSEMSYNQVVELLNRQEETRVNVD